MDEQIDTIRYISGAYSPTAILSMTLPENKSICFGTTLINWRKLMDSI